MSWLTAVGLCVAGLIAIIIEFFVPAAGIIGVLGIGSIVGGIVVAYTQYGTVVGSIFVICAAVITPIVVMLYFKIFPRSFVGRWLILGNKIDTASEEETEPSQPNDVAALVGQTGTAVTILRPAGMARIDGRKHSVVTGGEFIEPGSAIVVTRVQGNRIHVKTSNQSNT